MSMGWTDRLAYTCVGLGSLTLILGIATSAHYFLVRKPYEDQLTRLKNANTFWVYNQEIAEFSQSGQFRKYFTGTPAEFYTAHKIHKGFLEWYLHDVLCKSRQISRTNTKNKQGDGIMVLLQEKQQELCAISAKP